MKKKRKYIYLEKCLIIRILQIYIFSFYDFLFFISLSYAKIPKYIPQNLLRAYLPDDFPEMIQRLAKVLCNQVRRQRSHLEPVADTPESRRSAYQSLIMPDICHQCLIGIASDTSADFRQSFCQHSYTITCFADIGISFAEIPFSRKAASILAIFPVLSAERAPEPVSVKPVPA